MRLLWFKREMAEAVLEGRKVRTTRPHPLKLEEYKAVTGSRYHQQPFAVLKIDGRIPTTWYNVIQLFYIEEGFESTEEMRKFLKKEHLMKAENENTDLVYSHSFKLVKLANCDKCPKQRWCVDIPISGKCTHFIVKVQVSGKVN